MLHILHACITILHGITWKKRKEKTLHMDTFQELTWIRWKRVSESTIMNSSSQTLRSSATIPASAPSAVISISWTCFLQYWITMARILLWTLGRGPMVSLVWSVQVPSIMFLMMTDIVAAASSTSNSSRRSFSTSPSPCLWVRSFVWMECSDLWWVFIERSGRNLEIRAWLKLGWNRKFFWFSICEYSDF